jgi:anti-sigma B factor antagonist
VKHLKKVAEFPDDAGDPGCDRRDMLYKPRERDARGGRDRLDIHTVPRADGAQVRVSGELTLATTNSFREELVHVENSAPAVLVIDLRQLRFVDSTALAELVSAHQRARREGRRLVLVTAEGPIERLLGITGLDRELAVAAVPPAAAPRKGADRDVS